jgi:sulfite reductase alpha subunit-like flavoprotein
LIDTDAAWHESRAQQSNWETVNQLISLRTLTEDVSQSEYQQDIWQFEFDVTDPAALAQDGDPLGLLKHDCNQVPVMPTHISAATLLTTAGNANCWFEVVTQHLAK